MPRLRFFWFSSLVLATFAGLSPLSPGSGDSSGWSASAAAKYLDERQKAWMEFESAARGQGENRTSCVSCHTALTYALARPVLRRLTGETTPTEYEEKRVAETKKRVANWAALDTPEFRLLYDFEEVKKRQSWGTEAVLNALILATDDDSQERTAPSELTRQAFKHLWQAQVKEGENSGSWDWLDFGLEPWEAEGGRYFGASLAATAVGTAPGYLSWEAGSGPRKSDETIGRLRSYLRGQFSRQNLFNRLWALRASSNLSGVLSKEEQKQVMDQLFEKQQADGGFRLASLGAFRRSDGTAEDSASDGYATGLIVLALRTVGVTNDDLRIRRAITWLQANQAGTGEWRGSSVNEKRNPATHEGKFMSDAATAYAVLALGNR